MSHNLAVLATIAAVLWYGNAHGMTSTTDLFNVGLIVLFFTEACSPRIEVRVGGIKIDQEDHAP